MVLQAVVAWVGRAMLVRLGVIAAGIGFGAAAGAASTSSPRTSDLFDRAAWGEIIGRDVLDQAEAHWNDNDMGSGETCEDNDASACESGGKSVGATFSHFKGAWADSDFHFAADFEYDGCNITALSFRAWVDPNTVRLQSRKIAIQSIRIEPTSQHTPEPCAGCCKPATLKINVFFQFLNIGVFSDTASSATLTLIISADGFAASSHS